MGQRWVQSLNVVFRAEVRKSLTVEMRKTKFDGLEGASEAIGGKRRFSKRGNVGCWLDDCGTAVSLVRINSSHGK